MAEDNESNADPSMEEILASIRKIISDDTPPEPEPQPEPEAVTEPEPGPEPQPEPEPVFEPTPAPEPAPEEVLELTQMIQDDGSIKDLSAAPASLLPEEPLISEPVADTAASAFSSFANTIDIERMATGGTGKPTYIGNGARTLEDMTIELMRPLLREWLDHNLSALVERLVQKEIERISHR